MDEQVIFVECPECGNEQADMGRGVQCEECGYGPMPAAVPPLGVKAADSEEQDDVE